MGKQRTPEQLAQIKDYKDKALLWLDHEGEPRHVQQIRDHLGIGDSMPAVRALETALKQARDEDRRLVQIEGRKGMWRSVRPGQQPLPVPPAAVVSPLALLALTGLKAETVEALRGRLQHALQKHVNEGYTTGQWMTALLREVAEVSEAAADFESFSRIVDEYLDVAVVALRAYEALA